MKHKKSRISRKKPAGFKTLEALRGYLNDVPCINAGGCGISAYVIDKWLKKHKKKPEIVYMFDADDFWTKEKNDYALAEWEKGNKNVDVPGPSHTMVKVDDSYIDSHPVPDPDEYEYKVPVTEEYLIKAVEDATNWNDAFNRNKYLPEIEKKTGIKLPVKFYKKVA
jgi:hypothetical protein